VRQTCLSVSLGVMAPLVALAADLELCETNLLPSHSIGWVKANLQEKGPKAWNGVLDEARWARRRLSSWCRGIGTGRDRRELARGGEGERRGQARGDVL
jgi:hypothetical protein